MKLLAQPMERKELIDPIDNTELTDAIDRIALTPPIESIAFTPNKAKKPFAAMIAYLLLMENIEFADLMLLIER